MANATLSNPAPIAIAPRPWLERWSGECAFPVAGEGVRLIACCNPCGRAAYCGRHRALAKGPPGPTLADFERFLAGILD